jgi:tetratricopeptide (TPR) repeat protein
LLAAVLGLAAMVTAQRATTAPRGRAAAAAASATLLLALACGAKASAAGLALLWPMAQVLRPFGDPGGTRARRAAVALGLVGGVLAAIALRHHTLGGLSPYGADNPAVMAHRVGLGPVLAASAQIHLQYLWQLFVPTGLSPEHVDFAVTRADAATVLSIGGLGSLVAYAGSQWRRRPVLAFAVLGTVALALPTSNLFPMPNMRADRLMYLPVAPACVGIVGGALALGRTLARRRAEPLWTLVPLALVVVVQGAACRAASGVYRSDTRLWEIALRRAPASARAHAVAGELLLHRYVETGSTDEVVLARARSHCAIARHRDSLDPLTWLCQGRVDLVERAWLRAYRNFERALSLARQRRDTIATAVAEVTLARTDLPFATRSGAALAQIEEIRAHAPYSAVAAAAAGQLYHRLGHAAEAAAAYDRASALLPDRWEYVARRVELQLDLGHPSAAADILAGVDPEAMALDTAEHAALVRRLSQAQRLWPDD